MVLINTDGMALFGAEACYRGLVAKKPGYARFRSESHIGFDEPFHAYVAREFARKPTLPQAEEPDRSTLRGVAQ